MILCPDFMREKPSPKASRPGGSPLDKVKEPPRASRSLEREER